MKQKLKMKDIGSRWKVFEQIFSYMEKNIYISTKKNQ